MNENKLNDFYIFDTVGILLYEGTAERRLLIQCMNKIRGQSVANHFTHEDWLISTISSEAARIYKENKSKKYLYTWNTVSRLLYLDLEHYSFKNYNILQTFLIPHKTEPILSQSGTIDQNEVIDDNIEINKEFETHQLKSKRRRGSLPKRFSFDIKNSKNVANPDTRTPLELFEAILRKLHGQYQHDELTQLCRSCDHDISMPQLTANDVFLGNHFVKALITKFKRSQDICFGNEDKIKKVLQELGFNHSQIHDVLFSNPTETGHSIYDQVPPKSTSNTSDFHNDLSTLRIKPTNLPTGSQSHLHKHHLDQDKHHSHQSPANQGLVSPITEQNYTNDQLSNDLLCQHVTVKNFNKNVFDILNSFSTEEISNSSKYAFKLLSTFIQRNTNIFLKNDPDIYKNYQKIEKGILN